jgi:hypothetical protein
VIQGCGPSFRRSPVPGELGIIVTLVGHQGEDVLILTLANLIREVREIRGFDHVRGPGIIKQSEILDGLDRFSTLQFIVESFR